MNIDELINKKVNLLTIIGNGTKKRYVLAKCECGNIKEYFVYNILNSHAKSCGCIKKYSSITHGKSKDPIYRLWNDIKKRCLNVKSEAYPDYGGRGITVCERWINSFENFIADMGMKPSPDLTLERINVNGNYEPLNCKWATWIEQYWNKRNTIKEAVCH